ncbi:ABC transporter permease [Clostridium sp. 19966]|uniref:ABC transporter permease n=1 Tax=Clostridium sp. 19966 TaxID=2768166 RepID=UPI0028DEF556|nr:ABC transporter permease [Clostridium sp. 19966]MDT8718857.1 ABC transporter permease [Clostridium sp. 19966]
MYNLIWADLYKLRKSAAMKILFAIMVFTSIGMAILSYFIPKGQIDSNMSGICFLLADADMISIIGSLAAGIFICGDFENRIIHDAIANGSSRAQIIFSKALVFLFTSTLLLLPYAIVTIVTILTGDKFSVSSASVGFLHFIASDSGKSLAAGQLWKLIAVVITLLVVYAAQISICVPLVLGVKKPVIVLAIYYAFTIFCAQLGALSTSSKAFNLISSWIPYGGNYSLITLNTSPGYILQTLAVSLIFIFVMLSLTYFIFRKAEIK